MRRLTQQITDPQIIEQIFRKAQVCRLAMMDGNRPYIVPVNFGYEDHQLFIHSASSGKKIDLMCNNGSICFEIEDEVQIRRGERDCDWFTHYRSIVGYGRAEFVSDRSAKIEALDIIMRQHGKTGPSNYSDNQIDKVVLIRIGIESLTGKQSSDWLQEM